MTTIKEGSRADTGFSLMELIVVVVILGIIVAIAIPVFLNAQDNARQSALEATAASAVSLVQEEVLNGTTSFGTVLAGFETEDIQLSLVEEDFVPGDPDTVCVQANWVGADNVAVSGACADRAGGSNPGEEEEEVDIEGTVIDNIKGLRSVAYGNERFVATGRNGESYVSTDNGQSWDNFEIGTSSSIWSKVAFGNGVFIALSVDNYAVSTDGENWSVSSFGTGSSSANLDIVYGDGKWVVSHPQDFKISEDNGQSWETYPKPEVSGVSYSGLTLAYGNGLFVLNSNHVYGSQPYTYVSTDGREWQETRFMYDNIENLGEYSSSYHLHMGVGRGITYGNGVFVAARSIMGTDYSERPSPQRGVILASENGVDWKVVSDRELGGTGHGRLDFDGEKFVMTDVKTGAENQFKISYDGHTWSDYDSSMPNTNKRTASDMAGGNGVSVMVTDLEIIVFRP